GRNDEEFMANRRSMRSAHGWLRVFTRVLWPIREHIALQQSGDEPQDRGPPEPDEDRGRRR
ncbi:MAG TPA: hypothetical protein VMU82_10255, partial [Acetobacteraceae bacterium]|nr:hypothetical protein [Acetobacteraceae bacterium]